MNPTFGKPARIAGPLLFTALLLLASLITIIEAQASDTAPNKDGDRVPTSRDWEDGPELEDSPMDWSYVGNPIIDIEVSYRPTLTGDLQEGTIVLELFENWAPITVGNYVNLTNRHFYDDTIFHRVIDDFVIQGGDPDADDPLVDGTGEPIPLEIHPDLTHVDGALGMAREMDPDTAESQYYITDMPQHGLDDSERQQRNPPERGYAVFGVVRDGMSHVRTIACIPTSRAPLGCDYPENSADQPARPLRETDVLSIRVAYLVAPLPVEEDDGLPLVPIAVVGTLVLVAGIVATTDLKQHLIRKPLQAEPLESPQGNTPELDQRWK